MSEWISVEDRLPEREEYYNTEYDIVVIHTGERQIEPYVGCAYFNYMGVWIRSGGEDELVEYTSSIKVTHWKPRPSLPEAPHD